MSYALILFGLLLVSPWPGSAQERRTNPRLDVEHYVIEAQINPAAQTLAARVDVRFSALDGNTTGANFELNNALNVSRIVDTEGRQIPASRSQQDFTVRLNFPQALTKGQSSTISFTYDGKLTGNEESPVYGIKFAAIGPEITYLMYPARWFPINDYTTDRYTAELKISVPEGYRVLAGAGREDASERAAGGFITYRFAFTSPGFPGSIAVVRGEPIRIATQGITSLLYFRTQKDHAQPHGEELSKLMSFFSSLYGLPPSATLQVVETEPGTPNGYAGPGIIFLTPRAISSRPNIRLLANQTARQWWGILVSPATRNHLWISNGMARYSEALYLEQLEGPAALDNEMANTYVEALTVEEPPLIQSARLEDYSPEYWAATAGKGAAVLHMLRYVIGDAKFKELIKTIPNQFANKSITTEDFRKVAEQLTGENLQYFFLQWIESTGAPEFKLEYTVFRTSKGFRVVGKVAQDLDTFRMPVELRIETEGNPEEKRVEVVGTSSEFAVETFGKPKQVILDPRNRVLRFSNPMRVKVAIRRGEQFMEIGEYTEALKEFQKALDVNRNSSLAHYRIAEVFMLQGNYQSAANEFREALAGDLEPKWTEVWSHINLGKIFDITGQRERAINEYQQALRTKDNTQNAQEEAAKYLKTPYERPRRDQ